MLKPGRSFVAGLTGILAELIYAGILLAGLWILAAVLYFYAH
jgi:hypothetical protein